MSKRKNAIIKLIKRGDQGYVKGGSDYEAGLETGERLGKRYNKMGMEQSPVRTNTKAARE